MDKNIIISTTGNLQDYNIIEYCGYIEATETIGSGFITEISSSWADSFGIKSNAIENKINIIKEEAINKLKEKAIKLKCNAIIGLKIDVNEISSNQKMIFMISAYGTAVKCIKNGSNEIVNEISGEYLHTKLIEAPKYKNKIKEINEMFDNNEKDTNNLFNEIVEKIYNNDMYDFIVEDFSKCFIKYIYYNENYNILNDNIKQILNEFEIKELSYYLLNEFLSISENKDKILAFRKTNTYSYICEFLSSIIPLSVINEFIVKENDYFLVIIIYPLLKGIKQYYKKDDLLIIIEIIENLKRQYWDENIDINNLTPNDRICICGKLLKNTNICDCGQTLSINISTYKTKVEIINHLNLLAKEINNYFSEN